MEPRVPKWPFFFGDMLMLGAAYLTYSQSSKPMGLWEMGLLSACVAGAALLGIAPFLLEYRALVKLTETGSLTNAVSQIQRIEELAARISEATGRWQTVQDAAEKTNTAAAGIAERMAVEAKAFTDFMQRANDIEKANLRLEVEKLRRGEADWLQVTVRLLDHVYALHIGALRSGQPNLIEQLGNFQNACREATRRVGLAPFTAAPAEPFDAHRHQLFDGDGVPVTGAVVTETVATGYTFQGRLLRPALVRVENPGEATASSPSAPKETEPQDQLALDAT